MAKNAEFILKESLHAGMTWSDSKPVRYVTSGILLTYLAFHNASQNQMDFTKGKVRGWVLGPQIGTNSQRKQIQQHISYRIKNKKIKNVLFYWWALG